MFLDKEIEILDLNIKEAGPKMPPDVLGALRIAALGLAFIQGVCPTPFKQLLERQGFI